MRPLTISILTAGLLVAGALVTPAHPFVLCARSGNGADPSEGASVKIRSICKDNETSVDPPTLGLAVGAVSAVVRTGNQITTDGSVSSPASCEAGEVATGGGVLAMAADGGIAAVRTSRPQPDTPGATPTSWRAIVENVSDTGTIAATTYVVCARAVP